VRAPAAARPAGGFATPGNDHDAHMTIVDQQSGWEYDLWNVQSKTSSTLNFGWGGRTRIDGNGLGSAGVAAGYGGLAGPIRIKELQGGQINHALTMAVPCTDSYVYPANGAGLHCSGAGLPASRSIPMGAHFVLGMSLSDIAALNLPSWKKTILAALATYGAYVSDTTGVSSSWGFERESSEDYTSFGQADPWVQFARSIGLRPYDFNGNGYQEYWFDLASGVPWSRLRVVGTCAATGSCFPPSAAGHPVTLPSKLTPGRSGGRIAARKCWRRRAAWAREYRRTHDAVGRGYRRVLGRWARRCSALAA
jgi:hypothetical protein